MIVFPGNQKYRDPLFGGFRRLDDNAANGLISGSPRFQSDRRFFLNVHIRKVAQTSGISRSEYLPIPNKRLAKSAFFRFAHPAFFAVLPFLVFFSSSTIG